LNWRELRRLRPGTVLVFFEWVPNQKTRVVLVRAFMGWTFGDPPGKESPRAQLQYSDGRRETLDGSTLGVVPLDDGKTWHDSHVLVLLKDVNTLPTEPHWRNRGR
jgi:hypothetical protein